MTDTPLPVDTGPTIEPDSPIEPDAASAPDPSTYGAVLRLALPLVLAMMGHTIMMILDGLLLSWHSDLDIAALGFAGMAVWAVTSLFLGPATYTSTFVAQYHGAARPRRIGIAVWQGVFFAVAAGAVLACLSLLTEYAFSFNGHDPEIQAREVQYFRISCMGAVFPMLSSALSGYFSGLGRTRTLMFVQLAGIALNAVLDYGLIFGKLGLPAWGIAGAATATIAAQAMVAISLLCLFLMKRNDEQHSTHSWRPDKQLFVRLMRFGFPHGMRFFVEAVGWTTFVMFVGRLGNTELAATSIAFRINMIAFFPTIGLSMAASILVGQSQGSRRSDLAERATWRSLVVAEVWMLCAAACFVLFPERLMAVFYDPESLSADRFEAILATGAILLRFVAVYSLVDAFNVVLLGALQGAGDTRWTMAATGVLYLGFGVALVVLDSIGAGLYAEWTAATAFVIVLALTWLVRFRSGRWRQMRVIEPSPDEGATDEGAEASETPQESAEA